MYIFYFTLSQDMYIFFLHSCAFRAISNTYLVRPFYFLALHDFDVTLYLIMLIRKLRKREASKFHAQLCIAIFLMLLIFVVGVERTENDAVCTAMSVLIQYFTLASVMWMGAEAVLMFQKLILVFGRITTKYIVTVSLVCWRKLLCFVCNS